MLPLLPPFSDPARRFLGSEHDLRIPMVISGPGIKPGSSFEFVASNVDTMPTALGLAGIPTPASMDGRSFAHLLLTNLEEAPPPARSLLASAASPAAWRTDRATRRSGRPR